MSNPATRARMREESQNPRVECLRCFRPGDDCYCAHIPKLSPKTRVLLLQHPRERGVAIGTARMCHLALDNSILRCGVDFHDDTIVQDALVAPGTALLFPVDDAEEEPTQGEVDRELDAPKRANAEGWIDSPPSTLIVIDGTWSQARKVIAHNPELLTLPRVGLRPTTPGNYRIRREPNDMYLSTVEAISQTLQVWENEGERYCEMLRPFDFLVERQLHAEQTHTRRRRRKSKRCAPTPELDRFLCASRSGSNIRGPSKRALVVYVEANRHPRTERPSGTPELLHLVASHVSMNADISTCVESPPFELLVFPRRPLALGGLKNIGLPENVFESDDTTAVDVEEAKRRWKEFFRPHQDTLCLWGKNARDVLALEQFHIPGFIDVKALAARVLGQAAGGVLEGQRLVTSFASNAISLETSAAEAGAATNGGMGVNTNGSADATTNDARAIRYQRAVAQTLQILMMLRRRE